MRAALVSIEISASTFFWKISESKAFCAPAAPMPSSATSSCKLAAEDAALGVDLFRGELRCLHDRGRDDAVGA